MKRTKLILALALICTLSACDSSNKIGTKPDNESQAYSETVPTGYAQMAPTSMSQWEESIEQPNAAEETSIDLPTLTEIDQNTMVGTSGSFMTAVQSAVKLLDWGIATGLDPEEIKSAALAWMADKDKEQQAAFVKKMALVDEAYQKLLGDNANDLLVSAGCEDADYPWSDCPVDSIEAIMEAVGLR